MTKRQIKTEMRKLSAQLMELPLDAPNFKEIHAKWNELAGQLYK